ncbi:MAG: DUF1254 domain-containing protein [Caulobacteraceae bacterium]|nr:DUF1254 domain-containing protein [Caulobacteraceae bacterium]
MGGADPQERSADTARQAAAQIYIHVFPLLLADMVRRAHPMSPGQFRLLKEGAGVLAPGIDEEDERLVVATAWIDLSEGPQFLRIPDMHRRYFVLTFFDTAGEAFASFGSRTGADQGLDLAIVGPRWAGELPAGLVARRAPSDGVWIVARVYADGVLDRPQAEALAGDLGVSQLHAPMRRRARPTPELDPPTAPILRQVLDISASLFFHRLNALLQRAPDASRSALLAELSPYRLELEGPLRSAQWGSELAQSIDAAVADAIAEIREAALRHASAGSGWRSVSWSETGAMGPLERAARAYAQMGAPSRQDLLTFVTDLDSGGRLISGSSCYRLRFRNGELPPVRGYWRVSASPSATQDPRRGVGSRSELVLEPDGALELVVQRDLPVVAQIPNWLAAPSGRFSVTLRLHWPLAAALEPDWRPPPVERVDTQASSSPGDGQRTLSGHTPDILPDRETASISWSTQP